MKSRIGILGGSFNPIHLGHMIMAQDALEVFTLSKVLFVPCNLPPHKDASQLASPAHRAAMLERALQGNPEFELCDLEIRRGGTNYSIDTVRHLQKIYPRHALYFIIGSDSLFELHQWKKINELLEICRFVTFIRPGFEIKKTNSARSRTSSPVLKLSARAAQNLLKNVINIHQVNISSTDIRHRIAEGLNIRYLVPSAVEEYISAQNLYLSADRQDKM